MADTLESLTLDEAANIELVDDSSMGQLVPQEQSFLSEPDEVDEGVLDDTPSDAGSMTIDQAINIDWADDDDVKQIAAAERPVAILEGQPVTLTELVQGYVNGVRLQQGKAILAEQSREVEVAAERVAGAAWSLAGMISQQLPPMPDERLLYLNPMEYTQRKAVHDESQAIVENMIMQGDQARHAAGVMTSNQRGAVIQGEFFNLVSAFPNCATESGREDFLNGVRDAVYASGFSENDMRQAVDHRLFRLAHLAEIGRAHV